MSTSGKRALERIIEEPDSAEDIAAKALRGSDDPTSFADILVAETFFAWHDSDPDKVLWCEVEAVDDSTVRAIIINGEWSIIFDREGKSIGPADYAMGYEMFSVEPVPARLVKHKHDTYNEAIRHALDRHEQVSASTPSFG
jgi:hypothetical protein